MKHYEAIAERDEAGYWVATVTGVPGAVTQAKRLELLAPRILEVISLMTGKAKGTFDISIQPKMATDLGDMLAAALALKEKAEEAQAAATNASREAVKRLTMELPYRDVATLLKISPQRVQQIVKRADEKVSV